MWVNKEFISNLNEVLRSVAEGGFAGDLSIFDIYRAKKYQPTIELLKKFHSDRHEINHEINDILEEKYQNQALNKEDRVSDIYKLRTINQNMKNLTDDLQKTSIALNSKDYEATLPARDDHQKLRDSFNGSLRNVSNHVNQLNLEIDRKGKKIDHFRKKEFGRDQYLNLVVKAIKDMADGNDSVEIPWSDQNKELFEALQDVRTVLRRSARFLGDLAEGMPATEKLPCAPESQFGGVLCDIAESIKVLSQKLSQSDQLIKRLDRENTDLNKLIELITYYIEGIAIGDYTQNVPFDKDQPILVAALEQVRKSFEEISTAALEAAKGDLNQQEILPEHHGLVRSAFKQMLQSFKTRQNQLSELVTEKNNQVLEGQNQLKELLDYNLRFEKQYEELSARYGKTISEQQELNRVVDRLQKKNDRLEEELKSLKQKSGSQTKQLKALQENKELLQDANKRNSLLIRHILGDLNHHLAKLSSLAENEQKKAEASKSPLSPIFQQMGKRSADIRATITKTFSELEKTRQDASLGEIELQSFVQDLQLAVKEREFESGNQTVYKIEETAPRLVFSDEIRLKHILLTILKHSLKHSESNEVTIRIYRAATDTSSGSQSMIGFEIQAENNNPISGQQLVLEAFSGLYDIHRNDWDDVDLGLTLLREQAGLIKGELHLHSIQGSIDTYLLLIPLNPGATREKPSALMASLPESRDKVVFVLEDDTRFVNLVVAGFEQVNYKCLPLSSPEEVIEQARKHLPVGICIGMKWAGEQGQRCMQTISRQVNGRRIPFVALTETSKVPDDWSEYCIGYLEKTAELAAYQTMIERMKAYGRNHLPDVAVLTGSGDVDSRISSFFKNYNLEVELIVDPDKPVDPIQKSHLLVMSNGDDPNVEAAEKVVNQYRSRCPALSVVSCTTRSSGYLFRNRMEPISDVFVEMDKANDDLLYEIICLLQRSGQLPLQEKQRCMTDYLESRNELLKDKHALMITEEAASTMSLRKQLNQLGLVIRVATPTRKIIDGLNSQTRCDLVIINSLKSEKDTVRILKEIRTSKDYKQLPILLMSAVARLGDEEYWREKGANYFLSSSAQFDTLLSALRVSIGSQLFT